jgi:hypothetical protein
MCGVMDWGLVVGDSQDGWIWYSGVDVELVYWIGLDSGVEDQDTHISSLALARGIAIKLVHIHALNPINSACVMKEPISVVRTVQIYQCYIAIHLYNVMFLRRCLFRFKSILWLPFFSSTLYLGLVCNFFRLIERQRVGHVRISRVF